MPSFYGEQISKPRLEENVAGTPPYFIRIFCFPFILPPCDITAPLKHAAAKAFTGDGSKTFEPEGWSPSQSK